MKRTTIALVLLFITATTAALAPSAAAEFEPVVWEGITEYSFSREGAIDEVYVASPGCNITPTFNAALTNEASFNPPASQASARGSSSCIPDVDPVRVAGKVPTCTATILATVTHAGAATTTGAGAIVGYAQCRLTTGGSVTTYCVGAGAGNGVAFVSTPCAATATATPSSSGGCGTYLATGVNVGVRVLCIVKIVWA